MRSVTGVKILIGMAIAAAAPIVLPVVKAAGRPAAKAAIKGFLSIRESLKSATARGRAEWDRLFTEAKAEFQADRASNGCAPPPGSPL